MKKPVDDTELFIQRQILKPTEGSWDMQQNNIWHSRYSKTSKKKTKKTTHPIFSTVTGNSKPLHSGMSPENCVRNFHIALCSVIAKNHTGVLNF